MSSIGYNYITFLNYKTLSLWDVKRYTQNHVSFRNAVKLKDVLSPYFEPVAKEKMISNNWQIISKINFSGDLFLRDVSETISFKGNLNKVDGDSLIYSKINVRHGCIYYHPHNAIPFGVSSEYPVYKIDTTKVLGDYLVMVIQSKAFKKILDKKATGISKARVKPSEFLEIEIPIPALSVQKELLYTYNSKTRQAESMDKEACKIEEDINEYLIQALGIVIQREQKDQDGIYNYLRFHKLKDLSRWDLYNEKNKNYSEIYENVKLSKVILSKPQYGAGYSSKPYDGKIRYIRITDINEDGSLNDTSVSANGFAEQYLLRENDFLIARSGNTVGKTFLYKKKYGKAIYAGYLIRFELNTEKILPDYLLAYTKCSIYKNWIQGNMRVSAQPNINSQQYLDSIIVLPPMDIQKDIVSYVYEQKKIINQLKLDAKSIRKEAIKEFENIVF